MHHHDLSKRYHVQARYRDAKTLEYQDWRVTSTHEEHQDALDAFYMHLRKRMSRLNVRIYDSVEETYENPGMPR